jgi:hypothetical protein
MHLLETHHFSVGRVDNSDHHVQHYYKHEQNLNEVKDLDHVDLDIPKDIVRGFH